MAHVLTCTAACPGSLLLGPVTSLNFLSLVGAALTHVQLYDGLGTAWESRTSECCLQSLLLQPLQCRLVSLDHPDSRLQSPPGPHTLLFVSMPCIGCDYVFLFHIQTMDTGQQQTRFNYSLLQCYVCFACCELSAAGKDYSA
jgi:hypothetical protein